MRIFKLIINQNLLITTVSTIDVYWYHHNLLIVVPEVVDSGVVAIGVVGSRVGVYKKCRIFFIFDYAKIMRVKNIMVMMDRS